MGTDTGVPQKKQSVMKTIKNFPMRFRSKAQISLDNKGGDTTPMSQSREFAKKQQPSHQPDEELPNEVDTVAPSRNHDKALNPKLVVRATMASNGGVDDSAEYSDPNTAPHLVYMTSYGGNMNYPLIRSETRIGRKDDNHIILTDATISKFHAVVFRKSDGCTVVDRNSSNGVRVNEQFVIPGIPTPLRTGDCIMIGSIKLMYYDSFAQIPKQQTKTTEDNLKLVTILPSLNSYDEKIATKRLSW
jgi:pSer/pThr/pTyr-binding forkhead associated (FHA) protein